jgi:DNA helicase-2/ATP-dependent DNA helicase PcrA
VDEYQDTNRPQYLLVRKLTAVHRGICVVGDPDQSIYSWRGADIRNILDFEQDFPDARVVVLDQNYRSTTTILSTASALIAHNSGKHRRELWSELGSGEPVRELIFINDEEEARGVTRIIGAKLRQEDRSPDEMVILYRTNGQSRQFEHALREAGIGYTIVGGVRFYERAEIKDALAWLRLLVNPRDTVSLARALATPRRGIGEVSLGRLLRFLAEWAGDPLEGMEAAAADIGRAGPALTAFTGLIRRFTERLGEIPVAELARELLDENGYLEMLAAEGTIEAEARRENLGELLSALEEYSERAGEEASLEDFLAEVSLLTDIDEWEDAGQAVTLMTLHAVKGLEFPIVFITGLEEELCPIVREDSDAETLEEERRLCYVGMTRARAELYLTRARRRRRWGDVLDRLPSRFLGEIPPELVETVDQLKLAPNPQRARRGSGYRRTDAPMAETPDYENENQDLPGGLVPGQEVEHPVLGRGRILEVSGTGDQMRLIVAFTDAGTRRLMARYADLRVL